VELPSVRLAELRPKMNLAHFKHHKTPLVDGYRMYVKHLNDRMQAENLFTFLEMLPPWKVPPGTYAPFALASHRYWRSARTLIIA